MLFGGCHPLSEGAALLLGDRSEDVRDQIRNLAPFSNTVHGYPRALQLLAAADPLQDPPPQPVEPKDHDDDRLPLGSQPAHLGEKRLIGRPVVALA
jgi:hypothetical protein